MASDNINILNNNQLKNASSVLTSTPNIQPTFGGQPMPNIQTATPPPLPPRQGLQTYSGNVDYRSSLGSNYYGNYGYGNNYYNRGYGSYGPFSGYSPYSGTSVFNNYGNMNGPNPGPESRIFQYAEESTRSTLHLVESVLQTFSSITMMLESTHFAMTSSVRAVLSVAENITRLRTTIGQLLSTLTLIRLLKWICNKLMYALGLRSENPIHEEVWKTTGTEAITVGKFSSSAWPGLLLFGAFVAVPYLIHKISSNVKQIKSNCTDPKEWFSYEEPVYSATVLYDFVATSNEELSLRVGQKIWLAPQSLQPKNSSGWWRATDGVNVGLIPFNYVNVVGQLTKKQT